MYSERQRPLRAARKRRDGSVDHLLHAENIYLRFQIWTAVQVVLSSTLRESRERSVCVLRRVRFIEK